MSETMHIGNLIHAQIRRKFRYKFKVYGLSQGEDKTPVETYVKSVSSPVLTLEPIEVVHQTEKVYYPGRITWGTIDVNLYDVEEYKSRHDSPLTLIWDHWIKKYYSDPSMGQVTWDMSELKKKCELTILDNNGGAKAKWTMEGCWPTVLTPGDFDYSDSETQDLTVTLQFDRAYYELV